MQKDHEQTMSLLPWYVNDTLSGKESETVLRHLSTCRQCQAERDRLYQLQQLVSESGSSEPDYRLSYRRVMKRIENSERNRDSADEVTMPDSRQRWWIPLGLVASVFSLMFLGVAYFNSDQQTSPEGAFQTLSSDSPAAGRPARLELGFANPIPAVTLRKALIETHSNIVAGPDADGNYLVEVMVPPGMTPSAYLAGIRQIDGVEQARFASE
ncbi:MAG: zf-HC2 domain-containing protein [Proteobacteria bacterium]|nr:zf-HC2 domain-containing protein [Pseudomonadota bacterium]